MESLEIELRNQTKKLGNKRTGRKKDVCAVSRKRRNSERHTRGQVSTKFCGWVWYQEKSGEPIRCGTDPKGIIKKAIGQCNRNEAFSVALVFSNIEKKMCEKHGQGRCGEASSWTKVGVKQSFVR